MPTAGVNGIELYYEDHGEGDPPLVCVMGLAADSRSWVLNAQAFAERMRTITFDNRDIGSSTYVEQPYTVADMAADTLALADHLGIERFHLLGYSLGGTVAQEAALAAPERICTLTLAATWAWGGHWWKARGAMLFGGREHATPDQLIDNFLVLNLSEALWEDDRTMERARTRMREMPNPQRPEGFLRQAVASNHHDTRERLGSLTMPVHVVSAEDDILVPAFKQRQIAELIPGSKLTTLARAAHGMNMERAAEFNEAVLGFIAEHAE